MAGGARACAAAFGLYAGDAVANGVLHDGRAVLSLDLVLLAGGVDVCDFRHGGQPRASSSRQAAYRGFDAAGPAPVVVRTTDTGARTPSPHPGGAANPTAWHS